ncbi:hypothetical protein [Marinoscillum furvescens]|uniref:Uncharacterized protein n=1 Tax=Marinoscillum furvescens DSM 4134 TaxID=1122208 RepID=A0A3D9L719_MARFU|nr:hypothetical protein [Marinoscillum furvescens]REE02149.1 hypothetical protein C7460_102173 [Marinoscillum furvescens DSM 4134]
MQINTDLIKHKQRIYIGGTNGVDEIFELVKFVLDHVNKPADFFTVGADNTLTDAPVVFIKGGDELDGDDAIFHQLDIHILLLHRIKDKLPKGYDTIDAYVAQYEKLADSLPKAGTFIFNVDDNMATLIGKKEREDVKNIEYSALPSTKTSSGFTFNIGSGAVAVSTSDEKFPKYLAGVQAVLKRIGISDAQILSALKDY